MRDYFSRARSASRTAASAFCVSYWQLSQIRRSASLPVWLNRRCQQEQALLIHIQAARKRSRGTYGSPRVHQDLKASGVACGLNRVARIMHKHQVRARSMRRFAVTTDSAHCLPVAHNRLAQDFRAERPDAAWSGDITYLWTGEGWLYLSVVLDLYSWCVVG